MKIATITSNLPGETDKLISKTAMLLGAKDVRLAGVVKDLNPERNISDKCDMNVQVLPDGPVIRITQDLGAGSGACRLDPAAIAEAVRATEQQIEGVFDILIVNKFGPEECAGRGFRAAIAAAIEQEKPVLVGVGPACRDAFDEFTAGLSQAIEPNLDDIAQWCESVL